MAKVHKRAVAKRDLVEHFVYLAEHASIETADRFLRNAEESFRDLSRHPEMGASLPLREPRLAGLRRWQIKGLTKFLTFYLPHSDGVTIVRVLHASPAWWDLLGISACLSRRGESRSAARISPRTQKRALGHALRPAVSPCLHLRRRRTQDWHTMLSLPNLWGYLCFACSSVCWPLSSSPPASNQPPPLSPCASSS